MSGPAAASTPQPTSPSAGIRLARLDLRRSDDPAVASRRQALTRRGAVPDPAVRAGARAILEGVRSEGDAAVRAANERFGGGLADGRLVLAQTELARARDALAPEVMPVVKSASNTVVPSMPFLTMTRMMTPSAVSATPDIVPMRRASADVSSAPATPATAAPSWVQLTPSVEV